MEFLLLVGSGNAKSAVGDWQSDDAAALSQIAGVHIHAHWSRHTFATDLLSKGVPGSEVAAILGNSTRIVERHYAQMDRVQADRSRRGSEEDLGLVWP
jgi:integrase